MWWSVMAETLLEIDGIETCYGLSQVLFGLSLKVQSGEMVALMGRNGMGKTTTIRSIMGMTPARAGKVRFAGEEVQPAVVKLQSSASAWCPAPPDLSEPHVRKSGGGFATAPAIRIPDHRETTCAAAARRARQQHGRHLSGGEQQMLAIGRALMTNRSF
jgi:branched-chain amino acid transport system ATP-binding protein